MTCLSHSGKYYDPVDWDPKTRNIVRTFMCIIEEIDVIFTAIILLTIATSSHKSYLPDACCAPGKDHDLSIFTEASLWFIQLLVCRVSMDTTLLVST
jgi:hypothetical protein